MRHKRGSDRGTVVLVEGGWRGDKRKRDRKLELGYRRGTRREKLSWRAQKGTKRWKTEKDG